MGLASVTVTRPLEWMDTDAAGIWHHSTVIRFVEFAELEMHRRMGIVDITFGKTPRVKVEVEFRSPVRFGDEVTTCLTVSSLGRTSIAYEFTVGTERGVAAEGRIVSVLVDDAGRPSPLGEDLRGLLTG